jgi:hypothetical protein
MEEEDDNDQAQMSITLKWMREAMAMVRICV